MSFRFHKTIRRVKKTKEYQEENTKKVATGKNLSYTITKSSKSKP